MDGFESNARVVVIGATNRKDILDPALIRPGRFDRIVTIELPDLDGRIAVLEAHLRKHATESQLNLIGIARECVGWSCARIANLVNSAALRSLRIGRKMIGIEDLLSALEFEQLGPLRKNPLKTNVELSVSLQESSTVLIA